MPIIPPKPEYFSTYSAYPINKNGTTATVTQLEQLATNPKAIEFVAKKLEEDEYYIEFETDYIYAQNKDLNYQNTSLEKRAAWILKYLIEQFIEHADEGLIIHCRDCGKPEIVTGGMGIDCTGFENQPTKLYTVLYLLDYFGLFNEPIDRFHI